MAAPDRDRCDHRRAREAGRRRAVTAIVGLVDHTMVNLIAVIGIPLAPLALQSIITIQLMRAAFIRRGWREGY